VLAEGQPRGLVLGPGFPSPFGMEIAGFAARRDPDDTRQAHYFIVHTADRAIVGEIGSSLDDSGSVQIGYGVTEPCRGRGYATAAVVALTAHLQPGRVYATVPVDNVASRRVLEKAGFTAGDESTEDVDGRSMRIVLYERSSP
jgi:[ribosomal protein S5]-alanine N-acetyltransferase